ncbi:MAG: signal peptidase I [Patescibacteria group bacterium]
MIKNQKSYTDKEIRSELSPDFFDKLLAILKNFIAIFAILSIIYLGFKSLAFEDLTYFGNSMNPTLIDSNNYKLNKYVLNYKRGDIVLFTKDEEDYILRVIGMPGEKVLLNNKKVFVAKNKEDKPRELIEAYLGKDGNGDPLPTCVQPNCTYQYDEVVLENDQYYLLGDNRPFSFDSRAIGVIKKSEIRGKI